MSNQRHPPNWEGSRCISNKHHELYYERLCEYFIIHICGNNEMPKLSPNKIVISSESRICDRKCCTMQQNKSARDRCVMDCEARLTSGKHRQSACFYWQLEISWEDWSLRCCSSFTQHRIQEATSAEYVFLFWPLFTFPPEPPTGRSSIPNTQCRLSMVDLPDAERRNQQPALSLVCLECSVSKHLPW